MKKPPEKTTKLTKSQCSDNVQEISGFSGPAAGLGRGKYYSSSPLSSIQFSITSSSSSYTCSHTLYSTAPSHLHHYAQVKFYAAFSPRGSSPTREPCVNPSSYHLLGIRLTAQKRCYPLMMKNCWLRSNMFLKICQKSSSCSFEYLVVCEN